MRPVLLDRYRVEMVRRQHGTARLLKSRWDNLCAYVISRRRPTWRDLIETLARGQAINFPDGASPPTPEQMVEASARSLRESGFPEDFALARAQSLWRGGPRDPRTTETMEAVVREIFVPPLKRAGFRKRRFVWTRTGAVENEIQIQRGHSTGDFLTFTVNWAVSVPGYQGGPMRTPGSVVDGRIGDFLGSGEDRWWTIQLGWLSRDISNRDHRL